MRQFQLAYSFFVIARITSYFKDRLSDAVLFK